MSSDFHCRFEPEVDPIQMAKKLAHLCNIKRGASLDQDLLYFDALSAAGENGASFAFYRIPTVTADL